MTFEEKTYERLVSELFDRHPSVQSAGFTAGAYKPGLEGMMRFDSALGHPWQRFRTIHVAGTNGKGSVSSMLAAALAASGLRTGLYTSPHLVDFRERIKIIEPSGSDCSSGKTVATRGSVNGGTASGAQRWDERGARSLAEETVRPQASMIPKEAVFDFLTGNGMEGLSFFEITTGLAFKWFADQEVDVAVIEVGLGGRLDSTNIIEPELSIVTSIGLDHCAMLGNTRAAIAGEKAGIFKPGVPALVAARDEETAPVFEEKAASVHCPLFFADDFTEAGEDDIRSLDLQGPCQSMNLRTVLSALELLGIAPDMDAISKAAAITGFHGRWERILDNPEAICDIGHNPAALEINFGRLKELGRPLVIVYGIMADKDLDGIAPLMPAGAEYILAAPGTERALKVSDLHSRLKALRPDLRISAAGSVAEAVEKAIGTASGIPGSLIYIGGSTFVVSEAVTYLNTTL